MTDHRRKNSKEAMIDYRRKNTIKLFFDFRRNNTKDSLMILEARTLKNL
jgi:hypothetical protein